MEEADPNLTFDLADRVTKRRRDTEIERCGAERSTARDGEHGLQFSKIRTRHYPGFRYVPSPFTRLAFTRVRAVCLPPLPTTRVLPGDQLSIDNDKPGPVLAFPVVAAIGLQHVLN